MTENQRLKNVCATFVIQQKRLFPNNTQKECFEFVEDWARKTYKVKSVFASYGAFRQYLSEFVRKNLTEIVVSESDKPQMSSSVGIYERGQLSDLPDEDVRAELEVPIRESDVNRPKSADLDDTSRIIREESIAFLQRCVDTVNAKLQSPPRKKWTLDEIRADCASRRKKSRNHFHQEVQTH